LFTSVAFSESPEQRVGQGVLSKVSEDLIIKLESREVGFEVLAVLYAFQE
jgi:hypothetical protein